MSRTTEPAETLNSVLKVQWTRLPRGRVRLDMRDSAAGTGFSVTVTSATLDTLFGGADLLLHDGEHGRGRVPRSDEFGPVYLPGLLEVAAAKVTK